MASLSERLKRERELRGISLKQISEETRIGVRFLQALEEDRVDLIPGEFYRRSYLRAYARYLGLDEDRALNAYDFSRRETGSTREESSPPRPAKLPPWTKWILLLGALVVPAVLLLRTMPEANDESPVSGAPAFFEARSPLAPAPREEPEGRPANPFPPVPETVMPPAAAGGTLRVVLSVQEECWLEIEADGDVVLSGLKAEGFRQEIEARQQIRMWVGNAAGVNLVLNDHPARSLGRPGQVLKDLTITPSNFRDFVRSSRNPS